MQRNSLLVIVVVSVVLLELANAQEKYVECSRISNFCDAYGSSLTGDNDSSVQRKVGRPGKSGSKGQKGERGIEGNVGPRGPVGDVDHSEVERRIMAKVKSLMRNCGVVYENSCFMLVGSVGNKYSKDDLERKCSSIGARLANIYSEEHRLKLNRYVRNELGVYKELALGMAYNPATNTFRTTNGDLVNMVVTWHPTYPKQAPTHQGMFFSVHPDASSATQGVYNYKAQNLEFGMCEFDMDI